MISTLGPVREDLEPEILKAQCEMANVTFCSKHISVRFELRTFFCLIHSVHRVKKWDLVRENMPN